MVKAHMWIKGDSIDYLVCLKWNRFGDLFFVTLRCTFNEFFKTHDSSTDLRMGPTNTRVCIFDPSIAIRTDTNFSG